MSEGPSNYQCPKCEFLTKKKREFKKHLGSCEIDSTDIEIYKKSTEKCICARSFNSKELILEHQESCVSYLKSIIEEQKKIIEKLETKTKCTGNCKTYENNMENNINITINFPPRFINYNIDNDLRKCIDAIMSSLPKTNESNKIDSNQISDYIINHNGSNWVTDKTTREKTEADNKIISNNKAMNNNNIKTVS